MLKAPVRKSAFQQQPLPAVLIAHRLTFSIGVHHHIAERIVLVGGGVARAIHLLDQLAPLVPVQLPGFVGGIDDLHRLAEIVVDITGAVAQRIDLFDAVAMPVVAVMPTVTRRVGFHFGQCPMRQPLGVADPGQWIGHCAQVAGFVVTEAPLAVLRINRAEQLAIFAPFELPRMAQVIDVAGDLVLRVPIACADPFQAIGNARDTGIQVVIEGEFIAGVGPMPADPPFFTLRARHCAPLVEAAQATRQLVFDHAPRAVVSKTSLARALCVEDFGQVAVGVVAIADQHVAAPSKMLPMQVTALDMAHAPRMLDGVAHVDMHQRMAVAQATQAPLGVVIQKEAPFVAITQQIQAHPQGVQRVGLEEPIQAVDTFDQDGAVGAAPDRKAFAGAEGAA